MKDPYYYIELFKIEGHTTWRCATPMKSPTGFDDEVKKNMGGVKFTDRKTFKIDRMTGEIA